jgi:osmotically-inducible protein OsmY
MTMASTSSNDVRLRNAIVRHLDWHPEVDASEIGVSAKGAVATLTGTVDSYATKLAAERVVKHIRGVRAVANDLVVRLRIDRTDADIAADVVQLLKVRPMFDTVQVVVHNRHVTLTGTVAWLYQQQEAEKLAKVVPGILGIFNRLEVRPTAGARDIGRRITRALHHSADLHARQIAVAVDGALVTLKGTVASWAEREAAEEAASHVAGVTSVRNEIAVVPTDPVEIDFDDERI